MRFANGQENKRSNETVLQLEKDGSGSTEHSWSDKEE